MRFPTAFAILFLFSTAASAEPLKLAGSVRLRAENWSFFEAAGYEDEYTFLGVTLRASASQKVDEHFDWQVELAAPLLAGLPGRAAAPAPFGQLGLGASYFAGSGGDENVASIFPKQAFVRYKRGSHSFRAGRFELAEGGEVVPKNPMLAALKSARVAQRLIGPFGFTHVGRSVDGFQYVNSTASRNLSAAVFRPTAGAFDIDGLDGLDEVRLAYGAATWSRPDADQRVFAIAYRDDRNVVKTDNRPGSVRTADRDRIDLLTIGGHHLAAFGRFDVLVWGALQSGDWGRLDHQAVALDVEGGWHFGGARKPVVRVGLFRSSGDGDPADGDHETFFQLLPTPRAYARFPFYNAMNSTDAFAQFSIKPSARMTVSTELHVLALTEKTDLWYAGGGAFEPETFGFAGRPSNGHRDLARVVDVSAEYTFSPKTSIGLYAAQANGGDVVEAIFDGSTARYVYFEVTRRF